MTTRSSESCQWASAAVSYCRFGFLSMSTSRSGFSQRYPIMKGDCCFPTAILVHVLLLRSLSSFPSLLQSSADHLLPLSSFEAIAEAAMRSKLPNVAFILYAISVQVQTRSVFYVISPPSDRRLHIVVMPYTVHLKRPWHIDQRSNTDYQSCSEVGS